MPNVGDYVTPYPAAVKDENPDNGTAVTVATTTANGTTVNGAAFVAPPSGRVWVWCTVVFQTLVSGTGQMYFGPQVRSGNSVGAGTVVWAPTQDPGAKIGSNVAQVIAGTAGTMVDGLTPGATYNVTSVWFGVGLGGTPQLSYFSRACGAHPLD
jgi:hypothetical protein